jgi:drug/metabolite transporter (DMT)-like permease
MSRSAPARQHIDRWALVAAGVTVVLWSSAFMVIRDEAPYFSATGLALGRLLVGSLVLGLILVVRGEGLPPRAAWPGILGSGVLWFGVYMVALNSGEQRIDAGTAALVVNTSPILMAVLGGWLLREGFPPRLMAGIAVAFLGAVVIGLASAGADRALLIGVLLCLLAAVGSAAGVVSQKPALRHASALQSTTFGCLIGAVACLPFASGLLTDLASAPPRAVLEAVYLGLFPTAIAFYTWAYALSRTTVGRMGATTYIVPALVVGMSWPFLHEAPPPLALAGGALCLLGVFVSRGKPRQRPADTASGERNDQQHDRADEQC